MRQRGVKIGTPFMVSSLGVLLASLRHWGMLPCFAQSLGDAPSLRSVTGGTLPRFAQSLGDAPLLRSVAGGMLPCFAQLLGDAPSLRSVAFHSMVPSNCSNICILEGQ